jgi:pyruvate kinase
MLNRTKIICTIGPSVSSEEMMKDLIRAGMSTARLNFSHGTHEEHEVIIDRLKKVREEMKVPLAIMLDTKGPEIRLRKIKGGQIFLKSKDRWKLLKKDVEGDENGVTIFPESIIDEVPVGTTVMFDDGYISSTVIAKGKDFVELEINNGGIVRSGKGVNIPALNTGLPAITEKDIEDIRFGCRKDIDIIAASFVRSAEDVLTIKKLLADEKKPDTLVVAKIENIEGVENFDSIVLVADGIMIARGDLGVEVPLSRVPQLQKMMIQKSYLAGKLSVTATQMLESMINNPRPTRAEASDVANAIYDSTSAVMLSAETAIGKYPIETVNLMSEIIQQAEAAFDYKEFFTHHSSLNYNDVPSAVTLATVKTAYSSSAKAIFAFTSSGTSSRLLSRLRPSMFIIALTQNPKVYHQMAFNWGVIPVLSDSCKSISEAFEILSSFALSEHLVAYGDLVVVTAGAPFGVAGTTNMMMVENIGDVLVRGHNGYGTKVHGKIIMSMTAESKRPYSVRGNLLIIPKCDETFVPLIKECLGFILQNHINDLDSEKFALNIAAELNKPLITRADSASRILKEGQLVTLEPEKALIYKGVVL